MRGAEHYFIEKQKELFVFITATRLLWNHSPSERFSLYNKMSAGIFLRSFQSVKERHLRLRRSRSGSMLLTFSDFLFSSAGDPLVQADLYPPLPRLVGYHEAAPRKRAAAQISGQDPPQRRQRTDSVRSGRSPPSACERCCASACRTRA